MTARQVALDALDRVDPGGAYANLASRDALDASDLALRDRHLVTDLVHGTTRMRRACDHLVDRFLEREVSNRVRNALRLGAYQSAFLGTPAHAAVAETVSVAPRPARGLVNAVLRKVAALGPADAIDWPDDATRLSYPTWIVDRLVADLGDDAVGALEQMNQAPPVDRRADGYVQDRASQWVASLVEASPGDRVLDVCAAPGGKATALAAVGARVIAADRRASRAAQVAANAATLSVDLDVVVADGTRSPHRTATFERVLVDAPCSGLGVLRRRPDARWRVTPADVDELVEVQRALIGSAAELVCPGGVLVYSVCTLTDAEARVADDALEGWEALAAPTEPWQPLGRGARLLPQSAGTDGMAITRLRRPVP